MRQCYVVNHILHLLPILFEILLIAIVEMMAFIPDAFDLAFIIKFVEFECPIWMHT